MSKTPDSLVPRLLDRERAAAYLSVSPDTIDRLINTGQVSVVKLPAARHRNGAAIAATNRHVLIDRIELDELIPGWRERRA